MENVSHHGRKSDLGQRPILTPVSGKVISAAGSIKSGTKRRHSLIALRGVVDGSQGCICTLRGPDVIGAPGLGIER